MTSEHRKSVKRSWEKGTTSPWREDNKGRDTVLVPLSSRASTRRLGDAVSMRGSSKRYYVLLHQNQLWAPESPGQGGSSEEGETNATREGDLNS